MPPKPAKTSAATNDKSSGERVRGGLTATILSTATKLAVDARLQLREDPARALLLAVESVERTEKHEGGILPEAAEVHVGLLDAYKAALPGAKAEHDNGQEYRRYPGISLGQA